MPRHLLRLMLVILALTSAYSVAAASPLPLHETLEEATTTSSGSDDGGEATNNTTAPDPSAVDDAATDATTTVNETEATVPTSVPVSSPPDPVGSGFECYRPDSPTGGSLLPFEVCVGTQYHGCDVIVKALFVACVGGIYPL